MSVLIDDSDDDDDEIPPAKAHSNEIVVVAPGTYSRGGNLKTYISYFKLPS